MTRQTTPGMIVGTVGYMSPERLRGGHIDVRSDLFAVGAVLYEMLAGHAAFPGRSSAERLAAILARDPDPLPADLSPGLARVVLRALERDAGRRFPTARAFLGDLYKVTSGEVVALGAGVVPNGFESLAEIHTHR